MLPRIDASIRPVGPPDGGPGAGVGATDGRQAALQRAVQGLVGQSVPAQVLSRFNDGSSLVKVAEQNVRMMLPASVQVGAEVSLTVLSASPRPTFQLGNGAAGATVVYPDGADNQPATASLPSQNTPAPLPLPGNARPATANGQPALPGQAASPDQAEAADGKTAAEAAGKPPLEAGAKNPADAGAKVAPEPRPLPLPGQPRADGAAGEMAQPKPGSDANAASAANTTRPDPAQTAAAQGGRNAAMAAGQPGLQADTVRPQSLAATLLSRAPLTPSSELPMLDHNTPQSTLSATARALATTLGAAQSGQTAQLALIGKTALFGNTVPDTDALTQKLHDTISKSGLFYESHVTEWVKGERSLADLMREPQMQMQRLAQQQQGGEALARAAANGPDLSAAQMINQQLHTQEQGRVQWHGEAWPGQQMQWEVRRDQREGGKQQAGDDTPEQVWRSGVRFRLPSLGGVAAVVTMVGEQVHVQVLTDSDDTAGTLRAYAGRFESAMAAAGAPLSSLAIAPEQSEQPEGS
ncbi:MAG: flagellar hook-length control protein FliK [Duganella sp.]